MASMEEVVKNHRFNQQLYSAMMRGEYETVKELCEEAPDKALHILTPNNDTVLHIAASSYPYPILRRLLQCLPENFHDKICCQNKLGNTILHELTISEKTDLTARSARVLLKRAPELLDKPNNLGETALFQAAASGRLPLFQFLYNEIIPHGDQASWQTFLQRNDKATILHISVINQHFDLARKIAIKHEHLIGEKDMNGMTPLQLLSSCNPSAFKRRKDGFLKRLLKSMSKLCCSGARQEEEESAALKLAKFLIERDTSWETTNNGIDQTKRKHPESGSTSDALSTEIEGEKGSSHHSSGPAGEEGKTPLFLATKSNCVEIVQEILKLYPLAVEYIDDNGQNILHMAIKYRRFRIFQLLIKMELPINRLVRMVDKEGNSILHMVGIKIKRYVPRKMLRDPAAELAKDLDWFEHVKNVTPIYLINHQNHMKCTADELFATKNSELCDLAKEWLKRTSEGCSIVAVFIATVAFAAAYTIPGGPNQITGLPLLLYKPFFVVFIVTDVLSVVLALKALLLFLSILTSPFHIEDFKQPLPHKFALGVACLFQSVAMMIVAFAATISLMIHNKEMWVKICLSTITFLPVGIVARSHFYIYWSLLTRTSKYVFKKATFTLPYKISIFCYYPRTLAEAFFACEDKRNRSQENGPTSGFFF